jgi:aminopeptidase YwaD
MNKCVCLIAVLLFVCLAGFSGVVADSAPQIRSYLVKVSRTDVGVKALLQERNIPVNYKLAEWYIAEANQNDLEDFQKNGIEFEILDGQAWSQPYYVINRPQQRPLGDIPDVGQTVYQTESEAIVKIAHGDALEFGRAGFQLTRLSQRSLPLTEVRVSKPILFRDRVGSEEVIDALVAQVSPVNIRAYVQRLEDYETRFVDTDSILASAQWLYDTFIELGYTDVDFVDFYITPHPFYYNVQNAFVRNVIATKTGTLYPDSVLIIGGHYDTIVFDGVTDPRIWAPGSNDNASGTVAVLEAARILANVDLECTVKFACWTAEEVGLLGAWNYADSAYSQGEKIGLYINFDMISNVDASDPVRDITIYRDSSSVSYADLMAGMAGRYTTLVPVQRDAGGGSDHVPFMQYGYPIVYGEESDFSPHWHEATDVIGNMDFSYLCEVIQMGLGTLVSVAGPPEALTEPLVSLEQVSFDDDDEGFSEGNGNGHIDAGETIEVTLMLHNCGPIPAAGVNGQIMTQDPFVTIVQGTGSFPDIPADETVGNSESFLIRLSEETPNERSLMFSLDVNVSGGFHWRTHFALRLEQPDLFYRSLSYEETVGDGNTAIDPGETIALSISLENSGLRLASGISAVLESENPEVIVIDDQAVFADADMGMTTSNSGDPFEFSLEEGSDSQVLQFTLHVTEGGGYHRKDLSFRLLSGQGKVLLVTDDGVMNNRSYYTEALNTFGIPYDVEEGGQMLAKSAFRDPSEYGEVIWFTGLAEDNTLTPDDQEALATYLDGGGRLLLSGSLIGYDIGSTSFYRDYLHARYVSFVTLLHHLNGTLNPMTAGMDIALADGGSNAQGFAGETDPVGSAFSVFNYDRETEEGPGSIKSSGSGALAVETAKYKLAYFSFGLEGIEPLDDRVDVLVGVLTWFKGPGVDKGDVDGNGVINIIDALMAVNIVLGVHEGTEEQIARADMNYDGGINVLDVIQVVNAILSGGGGLVKNRFAPPSQ